LSFKNEIWTTDIKGLDLFAKEVFYPMSGLLREGPVNMALKSEAQKGLENIYEDIKPIGISSYYEDVTLKGGRLEFDNTFLYSQVLELIDPKKVKGALIYFLTIGSFQDNEKIMEKLMEDFWQTAYVDSARKRFYLDMKEKIGNLHLSEELGPGFFGMSVESVNRFNKLLDSERIGIDVNPKGFMKPEKSVAGLFIVTENEPVTFPQKCLFCKGNEKGCAYCTKE